MKKNSSWTKSNFDCSKIISAGYVAIKRAKSNVNGRKDNLYYLSNRQRRLWSQRGTMRSRSSFCAKTFRKRTRTVSATWPRSATSKLLTWRARRRTSSTRLLIPTTTSTAKPSFDVAISVLFTSTACQSLMTTGDWWVSTNEHLKYYFVTFGWSELISLAIWKFKVFTNNTRT